jgi:hypothetical protein
MLLSAVEIPFNVPHFTSFLYSIFSLIDPRSIIPVKSPPFSIFYELVFRFTAAKETPKGGFVAVCCLGACKHLKGHQHCKSFSDPFFFLP